ncbi:MAG: Mini-ribonuclease 3 [Solobacterium sp.]|nr:Mini-ribonuclease 3 [Solobacterium sp.]
MHTETVSAKALAYVGDAIWSLVVREALLKEGYSQGTTLQKKSIGYVSAKAQAKFYMSLHEAGYFTEEEEAQFHRGRNGHSGTVPKNTDAQTYRLSTGFEALLGYLYMENKEERIREIWEKVRTL